MDFLAVTPTITVGKDRVNEYFDVRICQVTVLETESSSGKIKIIDRSFEGLDKLK